MGRMLKSGKIDRLKNGLGDLLGDINGLQQSLDLFRGLAVGASEGIFGTDFQILEVGYDFPPS